MIQPTEDDLARNLYQDLLLSLQASAIGWEATRSTPADWSVWHVELDGLCIASKRPAGNGEGFVGLREVDAKFIAEARQGWPAAIRRALAAEEEARRLRHILEMSSGQE